MFSVGPSGASPITQRWTVKPSGMSAASSTSNTAPLAGVTLGQVISVAGKRDGIDWMAMSDAVTTLTPGKARDRQRRAAILPTR